MSWEPPLLLFRGIGWPEIAIVGVVLLLVFGAAKLPKIGSSLGQSLRAFKSAVTGLEQTELEDNEEKGVKSTSKGKE